MALARPKAKETGAALLTAVAVFGGAVVWVLLQQGEGSLLYFACAASGPPLGLVLGVAGCLGSLTSALVAWRALRRAHTPTQRFLARVGMGAAAIFALACLVMTLAIVLVPSCAR